MDQNKTWVLMARRLAGEATPAEMLELERLLVDHPQYQMAFELTQTYWNQHPDTPLTEREIEVALDRIMHAEDTDMQGDMVFRQWERARRRSRRRRRGMILGAVSAIGIGMTLGLILLLPPKEQGRVTGATARLTQVQTRMGTRTNLLLPDGTTVWLNAGSTLTYPLPFTGPNREVILEGEAFFDVAKNPTHPFIVHASSVNIRVLGTSFDVKAYARDKTMETTLIRGSIEVTLRNRPQSRIVLKPNEKLVVAKDDSVFNAARAEVARQADAKPAKLQETWADVRKPTLDLHSGWRTS
jgi:transmembrane sensor